jgi:hypothetical protein
MHYQLYYEIVNFLSQYLYLANFVKSSSNIDDELTTFYETITKMLLRKNIIMNYTM